ncbi:MAG TPA: helix-turn-helix transcriptional regulator, partial [Phototrophicaceae bacterium]|nr:helix-turn-helix transcriptional regulator [Phototrophicaceae bacterium]
MAVANLKLLGSTLRSFREQAKPQKISQFRLAAMMQWEGTAPVIEIEKGRRRPRPETLNALGEVLQLSPADIAYLHGLAGYREITVMPPVEQIKRVLKTLEADIARRLYPVYVIDFQFHFWMVNGAIASFQGGS